jgi:hypothetical protein
LKEKLLRVGTTYLPVTNVERSSQWYIGNLGAKLNYQDDNKAILDLANQSLFLVKSKEDQSANFYDIQGEDVFL